MKLPILYNYATSAERKEARNQYIEDQDGLCYWCNCPLDEDPPDKITSQEINLDIFPDGFLNFPIHLQHDHDSGLTEGAVHAYCNAVMWQYHGR